MKFVAGVLVVACILLACGLVLTIGILLDDDDEPETAQILPEPNFPPVTAPPCAATTPANQTYDPCALEPNRFRVTFWNPLNALPYFTKWKTANPGEWGTLDGYLRNGLPYVQGAEPVVRTHFGAIVRNGIVQCKAWVNNPASCP